MSLAREERPERAPREERQPRAPREERQPRAEQAAAAVSEEEVLLNEEQINDENQEGNDGSEGQADAKGFVVAVYSAAWLDLGGLDPFHHCEGRSGEPRPRRPDCPWVLEVVRGRIRAPATRG